MMVARRVRQRNKQAKAPIHAGYEKYSIFEVTNAQNREHVSGKPKFFRVHAFPLGQNYSLTYISSFNRYIYRDRRTDRNANEINNLRYTLGWWITTIHSHNAEV